MLKTDACQGKSRLIFRIANVSLALLKFAQRKVQIDIFDLALFSMPEDNRDGILAIL